MALATRQPFGQVLSMNKQKAAPTLAGNAPCRFRLHLTADLQKSPLKQRLKFLLAKEQKVYNVEEH